MYITSDLFDSGSDTRHAHCDSTPTFATPPWNTMADSPSQALGKRKSRSDFDPVEGPSSNYSSFTAFQRLSPPVGRAPKRQAFGHADSNTLMVYTHGHGRLARTTPEHRPIKQLKRTSPKRVPALVKSTSYLMDVEPEMPMSSTSSHISAAPDLRPCYICHTAPKRKSDLENYQECKRCRENTCYICVRQCADGCGEKICRKCCVEVGEEGDTLCLGCYARNVNS